MDRGPNFEEGVVWCFTWGPPEPDVLDTFLELLAEGRVSWVIVPIPTGGVDLPFSIAALR